MTMMFSARASKKNGDARVRNLHMSVGSKGNCRGFLLAQENQGLVIMFHIMIEARLNVGFQGSSAASMAYFCALDYAKHRIQGKAHHDMKTPGAKSVPIIQHPDVRRMLTWMKAHVDGMRSLVFYVSNLFDTQRLFQDTQKGQQAGRQANSSNF